MKLPFIFKPFYLSNSILMCIFSKEVHGEYKLLIDSVWFQTNSILLESNYNTFNYFKILYIYCIYTYTYVCYRHKWIYFTPCRIFTLYSWITGTKVPDSHTLFLNGIWQKCRGIKQLQIEPSLSLFIAAIYHCDNHMRINLHANSPLGRVWSKYRS